MSDAAARSSAVWVGAARARPLHVTAMSRCRACTGALAAALALAPGGSVGTERLVDALAGRPARRCDPGALQPRLAARAGTSAGRPPADQARSGYVLELAEDESTRAAPEVWRTTWRATADGGRAAARGAGAVARAGTRGVPRPRGPRRRGRGPRRAPRASSGRADRARLSGRPQAVADAREAAAAQPLRERSALLLMRALAREGRPAEAMAAGTTFRRRLAEETGLDPGRRSRGSSRRSPRGPRTVARGGARGDTATVARRRADGRP